jgi:hypothetical protein
VSAEIPTVPPMSAEQLARPAVAGPHTPTFDEAANSYIHAQRLAGVDAATALAEFARFVESVKAEAFDAAADAVERTSSTSLGHALRNANPYRSES